MAYLIEKSSKFSERFRVAGWLRTCGRKTNSEVRTLRRLKTDLHDIQTGRERGEGKDLRVFIGIH